GLLGAALGILGILSPISHIISGNSFENMPRNYAVDLGWLFASFSPVFILLLINGVPAKILGDYIIGKIERSRKYNKNLQVVQNDVKPSAALVQNDSNNRAYDVLKSKHKAILIGAFMALSVVLVIVPHLT